MGLLAQRFYKYTAAFFITAGSWATLHLFSLIPSWFSVCLFKSFTGIPCPGCGTTRAGLAMLNGFIADALMINPLGSIFLIILTITSIILIADVFSGKPRLEKFFRTAESHLKNPKLWIPLVVVILANWGWSITKGL